MSEKQSVLVKRGPGGKREGAGRKKGIPNKMTADIKSMILTALESAGGAEYLEARATDPRTASAFLTLLGKVLPMQVTGPGPNGEHQAKVVVEFIRPNP